MAAAAFRLRGVPAAARCLRSCALCLHSFQPVQRLSPLPCQSSRAALFKSFAMPEQSASPIAVTADSLAVDNRENISNCVGTGMDVQCVLDSEDEDSNQAPAASQVPQPIFQQVAALALLVSPFFFWGTSMVAMKPVTEHTTPLLLGSMRLLPAGMILLAWAVSDRRAQPSGATAWAWIIAFALVDGAAFQGFLAHGLQLTGAGLGSVIIDSQPLTVALLASLLFGELLTPVASLGLLLGVAGLGLLEVPPEVIRDGSLDLHALQEGIVSSDFSLWDSGEWWMLLAAQSMALGTVMVRWVSKHCDPVMATAWHMILGGGMLLGLALTLEGDQLGGRLAGFTASDAALMSYVSLFGGAASYGVFFYNATRGSLTALSSLTFLTPVFAAGVGYIALGETLTPLQLAGAAVTLGAVFLINTRRAPAK